MFHNQLTMASRSLRFTRDLLQNSGFLRKSRLFYFASPVSAKANTQASTYATRTNVGQKPDNYDIVIVGGGIVGLAAARELILRYPNLKFAVLEKEYKVALHQSGNNSGVIHAGIYYTPGSLKARLCVEGLRLAYKYCDENNVPYKKCGKLIVATEPEELPRLAVLHEKGIKNEVPDLRLVGPDEIKEIEPNCRGLQALHSPHTGIVDWGEVTRSYGRNFEAAGGKIFTSFKVTDFKESTENPDYPVTIIGENSNVLSDERRVCARHVITCGGLYSDRLAARSGCDSEPQIVPFRGDYLLLKPEKCNLVNGNIYPVPNPDFPFLGVHFTPRIDGSVWLGPNAVLAFKREGYKLLDVNPSELFEALAFRGLRKLVFGNLSYAFGELYRGINIGAQVKQLQRFVPELQVSDVTRGPSGVRAQALDSSGQLVDDFIFDSGKGPLASRTLHVRNAPSPAATSSLSIAKMVADEAVKMFKL